MSQNQNNNSLIQSLSKHFDLESELFSENSGFFYEGAQRQHNLETLRHLASFGDMVLFLTGEKGAGKTFLLRKLLASSFEGLNVIYLDCERLVHDGQGRSGFILEFCLQSLGVEAKGGNSTELLNYLLTQCHRKFESDGVRTLFAFDNADKLPKKELQAYCAFCKDLPSESALVMLFSGSSGLIKSSKQGGNLEQGDWWHQVQLKPLSHTDVYPYLEQALKHAGYLGKLDLTENQLQQMIDLGKGLPGRINKIFPSVVLEPGLLKINAKKPKLHGSPIWIMFGLAGLLIISFIFVSYQHGLFDRIVPVFSLEEHPSVEGADADVALKLPLAGSSEPDADDLKQKARIAMLDGVLKEKGISMPLVDQNGGLVEEEPVFKADLNAVKKLVSKGDASESFEKEVLPKSKVQNIEGELKIKTAQIEKEFLANADSLDGAIFIKKDQNIPQIILEPKKAVNVKKEEEIAQDIFEKATKESIYFRPKAWLQAQSSASYMAQILGSYSEETALGFINKIGKQKIDVFYLINEHKGKPWYVVFYGIFPAKADAQDAVKNAPKIIRNQNPWIRRSSDVLASYPK